MGPIELSLDYGTDPAIWLRLKSGTEETRRGLLKSRGLSFEEVSAALPRDLLINRAMFLMKERTEGGILRFHPSSLIVFITSEDRRVRAAVARLASSEIVPTVQVSTPA